MLLEEEKSHKQMLEYLKEAQWLGEEGDMCALAPTKRKAFSMFKELTRRDVGESEAQELGIQCVKIGWARIATHAEKEDNDDYEWYVHYAKPLVGIVKKVYVYRT